MAKVLRHILAVLCLLAAVFFLLPLGIGILHFGMVWPAALLSLCAAWLTWPDFFRRLLRPKWLRALVGCVIAVCMTAILVTLGKMAIAAADRPADGQDCTVVVLGCQVFPDGHPSLMLRGRINAAYDYLTAHPDALCVASGGQNGSEPISEAQCIRDTLVSMGIAPERILTEMDKLLCGSHVLPVLLNWPDVLAMFLPEIAPCVGFEQHNRHHIYDVWGAQRPRSGRRPGGGGPALDYAAP